MNWKLMDIDGATKPPTEYGICFKEQRRPNARAFVYQHLNSKIKPVSYRKQIQNKCLAVGSAEKTQESSLVPKWSNINCSTKLHKIHQRSNGTSMKVQILRCWRLIVEAAMIAK